MIYINKKLMHFNYTEFVDKNDIPHRLNGPVYIDPEYISWRVNGELHRLDGPAVIDGDKPRWYIEGIKYTENNYHKKLKEMGL